MNRQYRIKVSIVLSHSLQLCVMLCIPSMGSLSKSSSTNTTLLFACPSPTTKIQIASTLHALSFLFPPVLCFLPLLGFGYPHSTQLGQPSLPFPKTWMKPCSMTRSFWSRFWKFPLFSFLARVLFVSLATEPVRDGPGNVDRGVGMVSLVGYNPGRGFFFSETNRGKDADQIFLQRNYSGLQSPALMIPVPRKRMRTRVRVRVKI